MISLKFTLISYKLMFALQFLLQHLSPIDQEGGTVMKIMILINLLKIMALFFLAPCQKDL